MAATLSVRIDKELDMRLSAFEAKTGLSRSQAARELLRQILLNCDTPDRGWREGFNAGYAEAKRAFAEAAAKGPTA